MDINYYDWIGKKVVKKSGRPFKSKDKENTVVDIIVHPVLYKKENREELAFIFAEDNSYVNCKMCELSKNQNTTYLR